MTTTPYTPEQRAADARIAVAMGTHEWVSNIEARWLADVAYIPQSTRIYRDIQHPADMNKPVKDYGSWPFFHNDENARRSLLEWLRADQYRWKKFEFALFTDLDIFPDLLKVDADARQKLMLATPDQVARAADAAIREGEK